jgi:hypothetical protein
MDNEILLKAIENLLDRKLDEKLQPIMKDISDLKKGQEEIKSVQQTILRFVTQADTEFIKLEEKTKDIDKIKKVININNVK